MDTISIVTSLYNSESYINEFYRRHINVLKTLGVKYEFIFVDDGSPDGSKGKVISLIKNDHRVSLIELSRNFGQHAAMFSGLAEAHGNLICALDCDLEEAPENLKDMYQLIKSDPSIDVIYGVINQRSGGFIKKALGGFFYKIMNYLSDIEIPPNQSWQRLMTKEYVTCLLLHKEIQTLPAGLMNLTGFKQLSFPMDKPYKGNTSYTFKKRLKFAINSITAFSSKPLILICLLGIFITSISSLGVISIILTRLLGYKFQAGWLSVIASIWLIGGLLMASIGIVGIYVARIFNQVKNRPLYIIKKIHR